MHCNIAAEKAVLGCLMASQKAAVDYIDDLTEHDFYMWEHKSILKAMKCLNYRIDLVTLSEQLKIMGEDGRISNDYLAELAQCYITDQSMQYHIDILKDNAKRRDLEELAGEIVVNLEHGKGADEIIEHIEKKISNTAPESGEETIAEIAAAVYQDVQKRYQNHGNIPGTRSGYKSFDLLLGGMSGGEMIVLAARPAVGKSAFASEVVRHVTRGQKLPCVFFSLEMSGLQIVKRLCSSIGQINNSDLRFASLDDKGFSQLANVLQDVSRLPLIIDAVPYAPMGHIKKIARRAKRQNPDLGLIVIDYLQLIRTHGRDRREGIEENSREIKGLARELDCPILVLSQLSREVEKRPDKQPMLSDLREAGGIEQDADAIVFMYPDEETKDSSMPIVNFSIAKNRDGETGTFRMTFDKQYLKFVEVR